jgi:hypothetical protein
MKEQVEAGEIAVPQAVKGQPGFSKNLGSLQSETVDQQSK